MATAKEKAAFRKKNADPKQREHRKKWNRENPATMRKISAKQRRTRPDHIAARKHAARDKSPRVCARCGARASAAHHTSYNPPKHVWLCKKHHDAVHRERHNVRRTKAKMSKASGGDPAKEKRLAPPGGRPSKPESAKTPAAPHERIRGSKKNKPGSASGSGSSITLSADVIASLKEKVKEHNAKSDRKVTLGKLKSVWRRGAGAFSASHRPSQNRQSWAMARVNAFLRLVRTGSPKNPKYVQDNDLLPGGHPKLSKSASTKFAGFDVVIETRAGTYRQWGELPWQRTKMKYDYGYIEGFEGADGDEYDCYLGPCEDSPFVYVIHQIVPETGLYDEDKAMIGWETHEEALAAYRAHYDRPGFIGSVAQLTIEEFREKLWPMRDGVVKGKIPGGQSEGMSPSDFDASALAAGIKHEMEHTTSREIAQEIAMDHLAEDPEYYSKSVPYKVIEFFRDNPEPTDAQVHAFAGEIGMHYEQFEEMLWELIGEAVSKGDSYSVPVSVRAAAKRGLEYRRKAGGKGGLDHKEAAKQGIGSGVQRASNLMQGTVSRATIKRMHAFFSRHRKNKAVAPGKKPWEDKGHVAWLIWGGDPGAAWAAKMVKKFDGASDS